MTDAGGPLPSGSGPAGVPVAGGPPPGVPAGLGAFSAETVERFGRPMRQFAVAVSAEAMALAWANKEDGPEGAAVVVDTEIGARGLHGRVWSTPSADTLACGVILRPALSVEESNTAWLAAALAAAEGSESIAGRPMATWWPDSVIDTTTGEMVSAVRSEIQLGPGKVKSAVITMRFDLPKLGVDESRKEDLLEAVLSAADGVAASLAEGGLGVAAGYEKRCALLGRRVKIQLLPKGETRGTAHRVDRQARLELQSPSGMVERITVDQVRDLTVV